MSTTITCQGKIETANNSQVVLVLPNSASQKLQSRGMNLVRGKLNELPVTLILEPDTSGSHWARLTPEILTAAKLTVGSKATVLVEQVKDWPEPKVPEDVATMLKNNPEALAVWKDITPMARWDWIRWIAAAKQQETRIKRVNSVPSRMAAGKRRPCCFDRNQCTLTEA